MDFGLSEEQELLQQSMRGYLSERIPLSKVRTIAESEAGFDRGVLQGLAEQGVPGVVIPEDYGGSGLGLLDAALISEELGRAVTPYSFHADAVMAPLALLAVGTEAQKQAWLPRIAAGDARVGVAFVDETPADGRLQADAGFVAAGPDANAYVVFCGDGAEAYLVPANLPGLRATRVKQVDLSRRLLMLEFDSIELDASTRLRGDAGNAGLPGARDRVRDAGRIVLAADALGAAERGFEAAVEYAQTRKQFGRVIASFQAVKHLCAETVADLEPLRSLLWYAAFAWDERREDAAAVSALLKAHAGEVTTKAVTTCTQVFGGMGFTWECDMHWWFKRVGYDRQVLGGVVAMRAEAASRRLAAFSDGNGGRPTRP